jgi:molecular chaperone DnaK (HSP70)
MYLKKLAVFFERDGIVSKDVVLSCPSYFTNTERQAILDAAEIAGFKCIRLLNEGTAAALTYGFFKKADLPKDSDKYVAFVDLGHSKTTITISAFRQGEMKILASHSERNIGCRNIDYILVDKFGEEFNKKFGCDPRKNIRARLRMLETIEKQRMILSAILETTLIIECLWKTKICTRL